MQKGQANLRDSFDRLGIFFLEERSILLAILTYAIAVALLSLIVPLTIQELVNTFAFSVSPIMVLTLVSIMGGILIFVGAFRVLQFFATDMIERRIFVRVTLALGQILPRIKQDFFRTEHITRFFETVFMQRAFSGMFVDITNVIVSGVIGMTLLAMYHPYFLVFDFALVGSGILIGLLGKGGLRTTMGMSEAKYDTFHWFQEVADNLSHFKVTNSSNLILKKADTLAQSYVKARQDRFKVVARQHAGSLGIQVLLHTGLLGTAGWLMSKGELTLGQLVAAEVIVATLLLKLDSVIKRMYLVFYFFTALTELDFLFSLPRDRHSADSSFSIPQVGSKGIHIACRNIIWPQPAAFPLKGFNWEALPGEKWGIVCERESQRHLVSRVLSGLLALANGVVHYNEIDLRMVTLEEINTVRGLVFGRELSLFEGTLADNIVMGRSGIETEDLLWALQLVELDKELEDLPEGLNTLVQNGGKEFTPSQQLRILLARAIVTHPLLLILDGALHEIPEHIRDSILSKLCHPESPWTLIIVTTDANIHKYVQNTVSLC